MAGSNEHLVERFRRGKLPHPQNSTFLGIDPRASTQAKLNTSIRHYVNTKTQIPGKWEFIHKREIPTQDEISVLEDGEVLEVPGNTVVGPWTSKLRYLNNHYELLREDAITPLRNVVSEMKAEPHFTEKDSIESSYIYEKAYIISLTFTRLGIAARVAFSLRRCGKKIKWEQSKRLLPGTLVALTPTHDMFKTICRVAVVAARSLTGVQQNPPEVDIFFGDSGEIEIDPQQEWVMVESGTGYFEAQRHTLRSLQKIAGEAFPLAEYIVGLEREIQPPWYLKHQPVKNLSQIFPTEGDKAVDVDVLNGSWPACANSEFDDSQMAALRRILSKELAIVQGPPGTGKTFVSVAALKVLLQNMGREDPPLIVAAHTNHALDQLLRLVAEIEPNFIRLGGMTTDKEVIQPRSLFEIKKNTNIGIVPKGMTGPAIAGMRKIVKEAENLLKPLTEGTPLSEDCFSSCNIITEIQKESLVKGAANWINLEVSDSTTGAVAQWLGEDLVRAARHTVPEDFGFDYEEVDLEFEQLKELEAEGRMMDDEDTDSLRGPRIILDEPWTGSKPLRKYTNDRLRKLLDTQDMWEIPQQDRSPLYVYMQKELKAKMLESFRRLARTYEQLAVDFKIGKWEVDTNHLQEAKVIGCTTTGLSKYRGLLQSLNPKIVLIEEAAETFEAHVTAACFESLEHLILVGDHQQLRGHCNEKELEGDPFYLDISMFERLVRNEVSFSQLTRQRRMHPEIRRILAPIYEDMQDHPSVLQRTAVPGMGGVNSYFFCHTWPEGTDDLKSKINYKEAEMVVGYFKYLVDNGMKPREITVLTFYNGQRKLILSELRQHPVLQGEIFKVVTVDSYQGEENSIVLLSLVRSNQNRQIGFLKVANRVTVALSRAQRGFYIFGNARMICKESLLWFDVVKAMGENPRRVGFSLPLTCENHRKKTSIKVGSQFTHNNGGCDQICNESMTCGHRCSMTCHPFSHEFVNCKKHCMKKLECGHQCAEICCLPCQCPCQKERGYPISKSFLQATKDGPSSDMPGKVQNTSQDLQVQFQHKKYIQSQDGNAASTQVWQDPGESTLGGSLIHHAQESFDLTPEIQAYREFAAGGHVQADAELAELAAKRAAEDELRILDEDNTAALFGEAGSNPFARETNKTTLVKTRQAADGTLRNTWETTINRPGASALRTSKVYQQPSLLD